MDNNLSSHFYVTRGGASGSPATRWTNALNDESVDIHTIAQCVALGDVSNEGEAKLLIADFGTNNFNLKLRVFRGGAQKMAEIVLADPPIALFTFVNEQISVPAVGVACGCALYIYKGLKPFYKFESPSLPINATELEAWMKFARDESKYQELVATLEELNITIGMKHLTPHSQKLLQTKKHDKEAVAEQLASRPPARRSPITCAAVLKRSMSDVSPVDVIVIGCENGAMHIIDSQTWQILLSVELPSPPVFISSHGTWDVDARIWVSTREGKVHVIRRETPPNSRIERAIICTKTLITGMKIFKTDIAISCRDNTVTFYTREGKRLKQIKLQAPIVGLERFVYEPKNYDNLLVATLHEVRMYSQNCVLDVIRMDGQLIRWIKFGALGREDAALVVGTSSGGLVVKLFRRTATLVEVGEKMNLGLAHQHKLHIPKRTKIYIDQTARERENPVQMHQMYQRDLFLLRSRVVEQFAAIATTGLTTITTNKNESVDIAVEVNGFGPQFRITVRLSSATKHPLVNMWLSFVCDPSKFKFKQTLIPVAVLTSGNFYTFTTMVEALDPEKGTAEDVKVFLFRPDRSTPIVTAIITMPISELSLLD